MNLNAKPKRKPEFSLEAVGDDVLLYNPVDTKIISFNQTASLIWQLCGGQITVAEMVAGLKEAYPENADEIEADILATLQQFETAGCVDLA
jgi:hypothetical protein